MPQTSGGLTDLAGLDVNQFTSGPGYNQTMVDMIFAAREELDRMGNQQGGGQGIVAASPASQYGTFIGQPGPFIADFVDSDGDGVDDRFQTGPGQPSSQPKSEYPKGYGEFLLNPPAPVRPGFPTQPGFPDADGDGVDDRYQAGPGIPRPGIRPDGPLTEVTSQTTTPFDLSQFYAGLPTFNQSPYARQGLGSYNEILRRYYG